MGMSSYHRLKRRLTHERAYSAQVERELRAVALELAEEIGRCGGQLALMMRAPIEGDALLTHINSDETFFFELLGAREKGARNKRLPRAEI